MIIQRDDGVLVNAETGAKHTIGLLRGSSTVVKFIIPSSGLERILHLGNDSDCVAFLRSLAIRLGAVRWNADKRAFAPIKSEDSNG